MISQTAKNGNTVPYNKCSDTLPWFLLWEHRERGPKVVIGNFLEEIIPSFLSFSPLSLPHAFLKKLKWNLHTIFFFKKTSSKMKSKSSFLPSPTLLHSQSLVITTFNTLFSFLMVIKKTWNNILCYLINKL